MGTRKWRPTLRIVLLAGVVSTLLGPLLGAVSVVVGTYVVDDTPESIVGLMARIPIAYAFATITVAPFAFLVGGFGGLILATRAQRWESANKLWLNTLLLGGLLGTCYPLFAYLLGWGPVENLLIALPLSIAIGGCCGVSVMLLLNDLPPVFGPVIM